MKKLFLKIILSLLILFLAFGILLEIFIKERDKKICLKEDYKKIEYGESYNPKIEDLIDLEKFEFLDKTKLSIESNIVNKENKNYATVGTYNINVLYKDIKLVQVVEVIDTTKPELSIKEIIEVDYATDLSTYDFKQFITTSDLSELKDYIIDLSKVNSNVSGEYETVISIEDVYGHKTEKQFKIKILEKIEELVEVEEKVEKKVEVTTKKKDTEVKKKASTLSEKSKTETQKKEAATSEKNENNVPENKEKETSNSTVNEEKKENDNKEKEYTIVVNPNKCTHGDENYFNTREEAIALYKNKVKECSEKVKNKEITYEEYIKICPYGYEDWSCPYCGKWTISMYYRK